MTSILTSNLITKTLVSASLLILLSPIILPLLALLWVYTTFVDLWIKIRYGMSASRITGLDALFKQNTKDDLESHAILHFALRLSGKMNLDNYRQRILNVVERSSYDTSIVKRCKLKQISGKAFGYPILKDSENFNVNQHMVVIKLSELVKSCLDRELDKMDGLANVDYIEELKTLKDNPKDADWKVVMKCFLDEFGKKQIDVNIPQWQILLLEESEERYTAMVRFHHSIADGIYVAHLLGDEFIDKSSDEPYKKYGYSLSSKLVRYLGNAWCASLVPIKVWQMLTQKEECNPLHGPKLCGRKRYYMSQHIPLDVFRQIRKRTESTTNGILFSCMSSAVSMHFKRRFTSEKDISVRFPIPLQNIERPGDLTNKFAFVTLKVPTPTPSNPNCLFNNYNGSETCTSINRLEMIKSTFDSAKKDPTHMSVYFLLNLLYSNLPTVAANFLMPNKGITLAFSNMPGVQNTIRFDNNEVEDTMFWLPHNHPTAAIAMSVSSYNGQITVGLVVDEVIMLNENEGDLILQDFEREVQNILRELDGQKCL